MSYFELTDRPARVEEIVRAIHLARIAHSSQHSIPRTEAAHRRSEGER
jgi:hypothetical protein